MEFRTVDQLFARLSTSEIRAALQENKRKAHTLRHELHDLIASQNKAFLDAGDEVLNMLQEVQHLHQSLRNTEQEASLATARLNKFRSNLRNYERTKRASTPSSEQVISLAKVSDQAWDMVDVFPMISAVYVYIGETLLAQHRNALDQQTESTLRSLQLLGKQVVDTAIQDMKSPVVSGKPFMAFLGGASCIALLDRTEPLRAILATYLSVRTKEVETYLREVADGKEQEQRIEALMKAVQAVARGEQVTRHCLASPEPLFHSTLQYLHQLSNTTARKLTQQFGLSAPKELPVGAEQEEVESLIDDWKSRSLEAIQSATYDMVQQVEESKAMKDIIAVLTEKLKTALDDGVMQSDMAEFRKHVEDMAIQVNYNGQDIPGMAQREEVAFPQTQLSSWVLMPAVARAYTLVSAECTAIPLELEKKIAQSEVFSEPGRDGSPLNSRSFTVLLYKIVSDVFDGIESLRATLNQIELVQNATTIPGEEVLQQHLKAIAAVEDLPNRFQAVLQQCHEQLCLPVLDDSTASSSNAASISLFCWVLSGLCHGAFCGLGYSDGEWDSHMQALTKSVVVSLGEYFTRFLQRKSTVFPTVPLELKLEDDEEDQQDSKDFQSMKVRLPHKPTRNVVEFLFISSELVRHAMSVSFEFRDLIRTTVMGDLGDSDVWHPLLPTRPWLMKVHETLAEWLEELIGSLRVYLGFQIPQLFSVVVGGDNSHPMHSIFNLAVLRLVYADSLRSLLTAMASRPRFRALMSKILDTSDDATRLFQKCQAKWTDVWDTLVELVEDIDWVLQEQPLKELSENYVASRGALLNPCISGSVNEQGWNVRRPMPLSFDAPDLHVSHDLTRKRPAARLIPLPVVLPSKGKPGLPSFQEKRESASREADIKAKSASLQRFTDATSRALSFMGFLKQ